MTSAQTSDYDFLLPKLRQIIHYESLQKSYTLREMLETDYYWKGQREQQGVYEAGTYYLYGNSVDDRSRTLGQAQESDEAHAYNVNVLRKYVRKFAAVLGARAPNVHARPIDPRNPDHVRRAELAQAAVDVLHTIQESEYEHMNLLWALAKKGTMYAYTRWEWDHDRWGSTTMPIYTEVPTPIGPHVFQCTNCGAAGLADQAEEFPGIGLTCPECGAPVEPQPSDVVMMPQQTDSVDVPNGSIVTEYFSRAEVIHPQGARSIAECPWLVVLTEVNRAELARYLNVDINQIPLGAQTDPSSEISAYVRRRERSEDGYYQLNPEMVTWGRFWMRPSQYSLYDPAQRDKLLAEFPDGLRFAVAGEQLLSPPQPSNIDDHWTACEPEPNDTLNVRGFLSDIPALADAHNDSLSFLIQSLQYSTPINLIDGSIMDPKAFEAAGKQHGDFIVAKGRGGRSMRDAVQSLRPSEFRADSANVRHVVDREIQELSGLTESIFGGGDFAPTAYEAEMRKNQALAVLGLTWQMVRRFHAAKRRVEVREVARHSPGRIDTGRGSEDYASIPDTSELLEGGWAIEAEEAMPQTAGQIRQFLLQLMEAPPESMAQQFAQMLGIFNSENLPFVASVLSIPGLRSPDIEMSRAIEGIIEQLLMGQPVEDPAMGQLMPSIPPQPVIYAPGLVLEKIRAFAISERGRQAEAQNPAGYANLIAYAEANDLILNPPEPLPEEAPAT